MNQRIRYALILGVTLVALIGVAMLPAIPQDPGYHAFGSPLRMLGIPNFWNVVSNIPFAVVGVAGLAAVVYRLYAAGARWRAVDLMYITFAFGVLFTAFGSSYYHWQPTNETLVWDRLPMTIAFMSLFCLVLYHFESPRIAVVLFAPLLAVGLWSVIYWSRSEAGGAGDLRPYALVQFLPLLMLPLIIYGRQSPDFPRRYLWMALGWYAGAKLFEAFDENIAGMLGVIGGHPFKHVFAASATCCVVLAYLKGAQKRREPASPACL